MKKRIIIITVALLLLVVGGLIGGLIVKSASKATEKESEKEPAIESVKYEDFSFYDLDGREVSFLTAEDDFICIYEYDDNSNNIQTYRGVRIGDRATTALLKYNLDDFDWYIKSDYFNSEEDNKEADRLTNKYKELTAEEMLEHIPEINAIENMQILFICNLYEYENNYYVQDAVPTDEDMFLVYKLPYYRMSITVESEKIYGFHFSYEE